MELCLKEFFIWNAVLYELAAAYMDGGMVVYKHKTVIMCAELFLAIIMLFARGT